MSTINLNGLNVLLCRPQSASPSLAQQIVAAGGHCLHVPCMEIIALQHAAEVAAIKASVLNFDQYAVAIFISQNAVHYAQPWLDQYWPQLPLGQQYLAIGEATAQAARAMPFGEMSAARGAMDSEALLQLPQLQDLRDKKVLIFRGQGGREVLAQVLRARGATVDYCELYRRARPERLPAQLAQSEFDQLEGRKVMLVHSGETLQNLHYGIESAGLTAWLSLPLLCPSERVAAMAKSLGFIAPRAAQNAGETAMLSALTEYQR